MLTCHDNILLLTWNGCYNGQTCGHGNQAGGKVSERIHVGFDEVGVGLGVEVAKFQITAVTTTNLRKIFDDTKIFDKK